MKKIVSKQKTDARKKRNQIVMGIILVAIMFFSIVGYSFQSQEKENSGTKKITYNGFEFVNQNNLWIVDIGDFYFALKYNPTEVKKIYSQVNYLNSYSGKPLYVFSESKEAELEIYRNLNPGVNSIVQRIQPACLDEKDCEENIPIKTCEDNFIVIKEGNNSQIIQNESCVFIEGPKANLTQVTDEFLFKISNIES